MGLFDDVLQRAPSAATVSTVPTPPRARGRLFADVLEDTSDPWRALRKAETIGAPPPFPQRVLSKGIRLVAIPAQAAVRGLTLRNLQLPIPKGITEPITGVERVLGDVTEFGAGVAPFLLGAGLVRGAGAVASRLPVLTKGVALASRLPMAAKVGLGTAVLGAATKPEGREGLAPRAIQGVIAGTLGAGLAAAVPPVIRRVAAAQAGRVQQQVTRITTVADEITRSFQSLDTQAAAQQLQSIASARERHAVLNVLRHRQGQPTQPFEGWYDKYLGKPIMAKVVAVFHRVVPERLKPALIYRYGQPQEYVKAADDRLVQLALSQEKSAALGSLLSRRMGERELTATLRMLERDDPALAQRLGTGNPGPLSRAEQQRILQIVQGGVTAGARPDLAARAQLARETIDEISQDMLRMPLPEGVKQAINANMGTYTRRYYRSKEGQQRLSQLFGLPRRNIRLRGQEFRRRAAPVKEELTAYLGGRVREQERRLESLRDLSSIESIGGIARERLRRAGLGTVERLALARPERLMQVLGAKEGVPGRFMAEGIVADAQRRLKDIRRAESAIRFQQFRLRKDVPVADFPLAARQQLREIREAPYVVARTINDLSFDVETSRLFDMVSRNPVIASATPRPGWVKLEGASIRGVPRLGRLEGQYVAPEVADDINQMVRTKTDAERTFNAILGLWKFGKVPLNPATQFRNLMSNTILLDMKGVQLHRQPGLLSMAIDDIGRFGPWTQEARNVGLFSGTFNQAEIQSLLRTYQTAGQVGLPEKLAELSASGIFKSASDLYQKMEGLYKLASYIDDRSQGLSPQHALANAEKWLFNYAKVPQAIKDIRNLKYGIGAPFVTFKYKVIPVMVEAAIRRPVAFWKYPLFFKGMEEFAVQRLGLSDEDLRVVKQSQRGSLKYLLPMRDAHGHLRLLDMQFVMPYGDLIDMEGTNQLVRNLPPVIRGPVNQVLGVTVENPLAQAIATTIANRDPFTGREVMLPGSTPSEVLATVSRSLYTQAAPPLAGYAGKKLWDALNGRSTFYGIRYDPPFEIAGALFGIRTTPTTPALARLQRMKRYDAIQRDAAIQHSQLLRNRALTSQARQQQLELLQTRTQRRLQELQ